MLSPLKMKFLILSLVILTITHLQAHTCNQENDLSWINKLNLQVQGLAKSSYKEALLEGAELIVQNALESAAESKNCLQAEVLVRRGEIGLRQTLKSTLNPAEPKELGRMSVNDSFPYPKLLVFVSFSMSEEALKALHAQVSRVGGKLVLRGLVKGSFRETAQKLKELQIDIMIDPTLFEAYRIKRSPTFILRNAPTESVEKEGPHDRITGNVSLEYVLEEFSAHGETQHEALEMLKTLRREP